METEVNDDLPDPGDQTPPEGFEPQTGDDAMEPIIYEVPDDLIDETEAMSDYDEDVKDESGDAEDDDEIDEDDESDDLEA